MTIKAAAFEDQFAACFASSASRASPSAERVPNMPESVRSVPEASSERALKAGGYAGSLGYVLCQGACCKGARHSECKWCHLPRNTVNRLQHSPGPHLTWRRARGLECAVCPFVLASTPRWAGAPKDELLNKFNDEGEAYENFMDDRKAWEDKKNNNPKSRESAMRQLGAKTQVCAKQVEMLQTSERLGNLWPTPLYTKHMGKKPAKKDIVKIMHQGRQVSGVVLDDSHGTPVGTIALSSISQNRAEKTTELKHSDDVLEDGEIDKAFSVVCDRQKVVAKQGKNKDGTMKETIALKVMDKSAGDGSSGDDDAVLDDFWQTPLVTSKRCKSKGKKSADKGSGEDDDENDEQEEQPPNKARRTANPKAEAAEQNESSSVCDALTPPTKRKCTPGNFGDEQRGSSSKKVAVLACGSEAKKTNKELDMSEQIQLQAEQVINNLKDNDMLGTVTKQKIDDLVCKVDSRLTEAMQPIYTANYAADGPETRGMKTDCSEHGHAPTAPYQLKICRTFLP